MKTDVVVIGGGPSGISATISACNQGASVVLLERDEKLGGILNQCIHNGFGLKYFKEELTGPEYAFKLAEKLGGLPVKIYTNTFVNSIEKNKVTAISKNGVLSFDTKSVVLATGCRERTAGAINLVGTRPSGIFTAGSAQKLINNYGKLVGKNVVILGSGDIGLIMARRLTFEGAKVLSIFEVMPSSSGLARNIRQCVEDFDIPLLFNTTITKVVGKNRVEGVFFSQVDKDLKPIKETEKFLPCDTVLLSVGLIPENDLLDTKILMDRKTKSAVVNEKRQTSVENYFASGNVLHIHDLADNATIEGEIAGKYAGLFAKNKIERQNEVDISFGENITYVIPQKVSENPEEFSIYFRVKNKVNNKYVVVKNGDNIIAKKFIRACNSGEMQDIKIERQNNLKNVTINILEEA